MACASRKHHGRNEAATLGVQALAKGRPEPMHKPQHAKRATPPLETTRSP
ncbi:hypothetical protein DFR35_0945 [Sulfurisoma sediminicola]|uniref:Uncharacterized protein n=1 Tax=Sulfurisoma sediminicola TaxID=1381557 RepID=A0A497XM54_9PROT|nr:hypothetical protein DFR35_0945 [Sulfurisoma sediminicola]